MTIHDRLDWSGHTEKVTKNVSSGIGTVPQATLLLQYQALIQPHFDYSNIVWGNCRNEVEKLQNKAEVSYSNYDVDAGHLFKLLGWKNLGSITRQRPK